jgi:hypothetical protein
MWFGAALLAGVLVVVLVFIARDAPWRLSARAVTAMRRRVKRSGDVDGLTKRLIQERDLMRDALRTRAGLVVFLALAQRLADYGALHLALIAVSAHVNAAAALAAFIVSNVGGHVPFTLGGLGFVEAGLTGAAPAYQRRVSRSRSGSPRPGFPASPVPSRWRGSTADTVHRRGGVRLGRRRHDRTVRRLRRRRSLHRHGDDRLRVARSARQTTPTSRDPRLPRRPLHSLRGAP